MVHLCCFPGLQGEVKFQEGIRDVDDLRVLQIRRTSTDVYDWVKVFGCDCTAVPFCCVVMDTEYVGGVFYP